MTRRYTKAVDASIAHSLTAHTETMRVATAAIADLARATAELARTLDALRDARRARRAAPLGLVMPQDFTGGEPPIPELPRYSGSSKVDATFHPNDGNPLNTQPNPSDTVGGVRDHGV